ncbi:MAG: T9SS type A sorting domain-containing protein [Flavobacteriales bacterium]|nr:T9SS type A sorting domain-containing protein [Flavobacteriales bacterium]
MRYLLPALLLFSVQLSIAQNFSPSIYSPALWLDASDTNSIVHTAGAVSSWNDISGNGNHATQTTALNQPLYISTSAGVEFNGIDDILIGNNLQYGIDTTITLFVVAAPDSGSNKGSVIAKGQWTSGNDYRIELGEQGYEICIQNAREWNSSAGDWNIAHKNLVHTYYDGNDEVGYYLNGAWHELLLTDSTYSPNNNPFSIGGRFNYSNYFDGKIYEVLLFQSKLSRCEILKIEGYLFNKWNKQSYIINTHPYKNNLFGLCEEIQEYIDENSSIGTTIGTLQGAYIDAPVVFTDWRIEDDGLYEGMFALSAAGVLTVSNNTYLDYELASAFNIEVSTVSSGIRVYGSVRINVNDLPDGGTQKIHSELWGISGEKWNPRGRLPDFSYVGYESGEKNYHYAPTVVDVTTFGAINTDSISDVSAINAAIASIDSGIVYFPPGLYIIDDVISISKDNLVLRGAGNDSLTGTRFYFPLSGTDLGIPGNLNSGDAGYLINFSGSNAGPSYDIVENVKMGDRSVTVSDPSVFNVGDFVNIEYSGSHPSDGALWGHILNDQNYVWPCSIAWSTGNGGLGMYHKIERIEGDIITLKEPIRLDLKVTWSPKLHLRTDWYITNSGIENLYIEHAYIVKPSHLNEPGYNTIAFDFSFNCWANNISIKHADNGILFKNSGYGEMKNITFRGRGGHHGWKFAYSSHCLADTIDFQSYDLWTHSFTLTHKANGNVVSNLTGIPGIPISTDFHRNTPWETLIVNVENDWNYNSSGVWCAGPNAGKRTVYWNMGGDGITSFPIWDDYQTTLVGDLSISEKFHTEKGWHEHVPNIEPANLYHAQLDRRLNLPADPLFTLDVLLGDRANYWERDPSRWRIKDGSYQIHFSELPPLSGGRLGEYTLLDTIFLTDVAITTNAKSLERLNINTAADLALIVNYQDDENYYFMDISANASQSGIYKTENGLATLLSPIAALISDTTIHQYSLQRVGDSLKAYFDCQISNTVFDTTFMIGKVGFGSFDDAALFDDIMINNVPLAATSVIDDTTCSNDPYFFNGQVYNTTGTYMAIMQTQNGCDSTVTLNLEVLPTPMASLSFVNDTLISSNGINYDWYLDNSLLVSTTDSILVTNTNGDYTVVVFFSNGCSDTSSIVTINFTSLWEFNSTNALHIYPNPTNSFLYVEGSSDELSAVRIFNLIGEELKQATHISIIDENKLLINLEKLPAGMYLIKTKTIANMLYKQ